MFGKTTSYAIHTKQRTIYTSLCAQVQTLLLNGPAVTRSWIREQKLEMESLFENTLNESTRKVNNSTATLF